MARTRGKSNATPATTPSDTPNNKILKSQESNQSNSSAENTKAAQDAMKGNHIPNGSAVAAAENRSLTTSVVNNSVSSVNPFQLMEENRMSSSAPLPDLCNTTIVANHSVKSNGHHIEIDEQFPSNISVSNSYNNTSSRTLSANEVTSPTQTNGYSSHEDMSCTTRLV